MKIRYTILWICILMLLPFTGRAQQTLTVSGTVTDQDGQPLPGASVVVQGTTNGAQTDFDGNFTLEDVPSDAVLEVSYLGFTSLDVEVSGQTTLAISLQEDAQALDEVIVVGYGTAKKRDLAGSIVKVEGDEVADKPNANPVASLQGKVAGLSVVNSGQPGQEPDIRIRGTVSRNQTKPLYVVDGIFSEDISFINPNDIESIELLKDPSSLAIFGVRGANGVILVTTKKARAGALSVNFSASTGVKYITGKPDLADAALFKTLFDERLVNDGLEPYGNYDLFTGDTDWIDQIKNDGAPVQIANLSIQSGTESNKLSIGLGYLKEEGIVRNEELQRITFNVNDEVTLSENLKFGIGLNGVKSDLPGPPPNSPYNFGAALIATPVVSPFNPDGVYNQLPIAIGGAQVGNPLLVVNERLPTTVDDTYQFVGNVFAELRFLKDFTFRTAFMGNYSIDKGRGYSPLTPVYVAESDEITNFSGQILTSVMRKFEIL